MKSFITLLLLCLVSQPALAGRDDLIIYKSGDGTYVRTEVNDHCVEKGYIRTKDSKKAQRTFCDIIGPDGRQSIEECEDEYIVHEVLKRHMYLKETIHLGSSRVFTRYYRDKYVAKRTFPKCEDEIIDYAHGMYVTREANMQERLMYGALHQKGITSITNETISPKQASEGRWGEDGDSMRSIMIYYDSPNCNSGTVENGNNEFSEANFFRMGGEGSGSGRLGGEGSGSGHVGGEGSGTGRVMTRMNITPQRLNTLRIRPNQIERQLGIRPDMARYLTGEEEIPGSVMGVRCQK